MKEKKNKTQKNTNEPLQPVEKPPPEEEKLESCFGLEREEREERKDGEADYGQGLHWQYLKWYMNNIDKMSKVQRRK